MEGPKVTEEIRRSDGDLTRSEIREYHLEVESRLSIAAGDTGERTWRGMLSRSTAWTDHVLVSTGVVRGRREWMT